MNFRKAAVEKLAGFLEKELVQVKHKIQQNKWGIKKLVEEQNILKRERVQIVEVVQLLREKRKII